jgi:protein-L-isoaspartate(D-aspartate) O-methyltransferase
MEDSYKHKGMRRLLVKKLREKQINDPIVLAAIEKIPRHLFFDNAFVEQAYKDIAFPIGEGQTISQPYTVAYQTMLLRVRPGDKILEIGTGSGYQCCILLELGAKVYTIEKIPALYYRCVKLLSRLGYQPNFFLGDGTMGLPQFAPFNKIIVTAGSPHIPVQLKEQLAPGGILIIPVGNEASQNMIRIEKKTDGSYVQEELGQFRFVPLIGKDGWK